MFYFTKTDRIVLSLSTLLVTYVTLELSLILQSGVVALIILLFCVWNLCYINTSLDVFKDFSETKETL